MADLCALFRRTARTRACRDCGEPRCMCLRVQQAEDRQADLDRALRSETALAFAELSAWSYAARRRGEK
jgi:hypothetical protein